MQEPELIRATWCLAHWTIVLAVLTFVVVVVALFGEQIWRSLRRPRLKVRYHLQKGQVGSNNSFADTYFVRLYVHNDGKTSAKNVQVMLRGVEPLDSPGSGQLSFMPMYLSWLYHEKKGGRPNPWLPYIPPGTGAYCNLAQVVRPQAPKVQDDSNVTQPENAENPLANIQLQFVTVKTPLGTRVQWPPGKYKVQIQVAAENATAVSDAKEITCPAWNDDEEQMRIAMLGSAK